MELEEAKKIFKSWQDFMEMTDKLRVSFCTLRLPETILPYPKDAMRKAISIIRQEYRDSGNEKAVELIDNNSMVNFNCYVENEEAYKVMALMINHCLEDPETMKNHIKSAKERQDKWVKLNNDNNISVNKIIEEDKPSQQQSNESKNKKGGLGAVIFPFVLWGIIGWILIGSFPPGNARLLAGIVTIGGFCWHFWWLAKNEGK